MDNVRGASVLLTGGSRGIGPVIAEALAKRGANVALAARSDSDLHAVIQRLGSIGPRVLAFPVDLGSASQRKKLIADVLAEFGRIDVLINNAGLECEGPFAELSCGDIRETVEVNFTASVVLTRLVLPEMLSRRSGHIVNMSSLAGKSGIPFDAVYSGTKAALAEWARALRLELAGTGVHFSTIFPGYVTEVGMFAKFAKQSPWTVGSCTAEEVASGVLEALEKCKPEIIVNSRPVSYSFMINQLSPVFGDWLMRFGGVVDFQRRKASHADSSQVVSSHK